jgi:precorrin-2 dehydrogenase/sirohydrochlorin ferrochelatase
LIQTTNNDKTYEINGKSPTTAKRVRQLLEDVLPEEIDDLLQNLNAYRDTLKGDFEYKVKAMNEITETLVKKVKF